MAWRGRWLDAISSSSGLPPAASVSVLPRIMGRAGPLRSSQARDGTVIDHGHIYVAPPDYHLVVRRGHVRLLQGSREHKHRPAVDYRLPVAEIPSLLLRLVREEVEEKQLALAPDDLDVMAQVESGPYSKSGTA